MSTLYKGGLLHLYVLFKFILDISDIGEGKHHEETWT